MSHLERDAPLRHAVSESLISILLLDDGTPERHQVKTWLCDDDRFLLVEPRGSDALERLADPSVDVVVCELSASGLTHLEILEAVRNQGGRPFVVVLTSSGSERCAVEALRGGAADYISKHEANYCQRLTDSIVSIATRPESIGRVLAADAQAAWFVDALSLVSVIGFDGYLKRWNPAWKEVFGYDREEMMRTRLADVVHPDDRARNLALRERVYAGQSVHGIEARIRCKDGTYKRLMWNSIPCVEQQVYFATWQDITAHKLVEEQLRESQERFQLLSVATDESVWDWDLRTNQIWRNDTLVQTFGEPSSADEDATDWWIGLIHPEDRTLAAESFQGREANGRQQWTTEYRIRKLNGTYAQVYTRGFTIFDEQGQPSRMVGSIIDITQLKFAEEQLRESAERFRLAAKATRDAIWDWDLRQGEIWRSEGFQTLFGYAEDAISPDLSWWVERIHPDDRSRVLAQFTPSTTVDSGQCAFEYRFQRADGTYADVFDRGYVIRNHDGQPVRMVGSVMDVSARRRAEEMVHMQRAELAHIARVSTMGEIATGLAHELNQPLAAVMNYAESCTQAIRAKGSKSDAKLLEWIEKISINTHRAGEMIRRLRGFTRKSEPRRSTVEINELIQEVLDLLEAETRLQEVRVQWKRQPEVYVTVDRIQVQQVLVNLLRNAYEAMEDVEPSKRKVKITATANCDKMEIAVTDVGKGIERPIVDRVFDAFVTTKANGVGVGLAISRSIIEDHGGKLWLTPNPREGVSFHFTLPMSGAFL